MRRTLRIFPLYYGIMLLMLLADPLMHWQWNWKWLAWPAYLGNYVRFAHPYNLGDPLEMLGDFQLTGSLGHHHLTFSLAHFWSLCVEEQFYLIWPWAVFWIRDRKKLAWVCAATFPLCLAMRLLGQHYFPGWMLEKEFLNRATPFRLDSLLLGGLLALVLRGHYSQLLLKLARRAFPVVLGLVFIWLIFAPHRHFWRQPYLYPDWKYTWGLGVVDVLSGLLVLVALQSGSLVHRFFMLRPLRWMGRLSYGAYVFHDIPHSIYRDLSLRMARHLALEMRFSEHFMHVLVSSCIS